jgi:tetratricopeptide (TPR) repeat protein
LRCLVYPGFLILAVSLLFSCANRPVTRSGPGVESPQAFLARDQAYDYFILGNSLFIRNNPHLALEAYKKALQLDPDPYLMFLVGKACVDLGDYKSALKYFQELVRRKPDRPEFWLELAELQQFIGKEEDAFKSLEKCLRLDPENNEALYLQAQLYLTRQKYAETLASLQALQKNMPYNHDLQVKIARVAQSAKNFALAESLYIQVLRTNPRHTEALRQLSTVLDSRKEIGHRIAVYQALQQAHPESADFVRLLASQYLKNNQWEQALGTYSTLVSSGSKNYDVRKTMAILLYESGRLDTAKAMLRELTAEDTADYETFYYLGTIALDQKQFPAARENLRTVLRLQPDFKDAEINLGISYILTRDFTESASIFDRMIAHYPVWSSPLYFRGLGCSRQKEYRQAIPYLEKARALDRKNKSVLFDLAAAYERAGQFGPAVKTFKALLDLYPEDAPSLNYLGYMYAEKGTKLGEAKTMLEKALALEPKNGAYLDSYGWIFYKLGDLNQALANVSGALEYMKDDVTIYEHLAIIYDSLGRKDETLLFGQKALVLDAANKPMRDLLKKYGVAPPSPVPADRTSPPPEP